MDTVFTLSDNYTIILPLELRKRLGDPSAYNKKGSRELFLFWAVKGHTTYVVIHTSIHFSHSPGYAYTCKIQDGIVTIPKNILLELKPGRQLRFDGAVYPSVPVWLEIL